MSDPPANDSTFWVTVTGVALTAAGLIIGVATGWIKAVSARRQRVNEAIDAVRKEVLAASDGAKNQLAAAIKEIGVQAQVDRHQMRGAMDVQFERLREDQKEMHEGNHQSLSEIRQRITRVETLVKANHK